MLSYYFPGGGFGFWYLLGIYIKIREITPNSNSYKLVGCSAGSLICLVSLLKEEYINFDFLLFIYKQSTKEQGRILNIYMLIHKLCEVVKDYIDYEKLSLNLQNLRIHITEINFFLGCIPKLKKKIAIPIDLEDLKYLILASCQIPILGRSQNHCFFIEIHNKLYIDGMFSENQLNEEDCIQKIDSWGHLSLNFPSDYQIQQMYSSGYKYR